jgi:hypothetical protein
MYDRKNGAPKKWREALHSGYFHSFRFLTEKHPKFPQEIEINTGGRGGLFEMGGQRDNSGFAIVVTGPGGHPSHAKILPFRNFNSLHASVDIWPGCMVLVGYHRMGSARFAVYRIESTEPCKKEQQFGTAKLSLVKGHVAGKRGLDSSWLDSLIAVHPALKNAFDALYKKLFTFNCTEAMYVEQFHDVTRDEARDVYANVYGADDSKHTLEKSGIGDEYVDVVYDCANFSVFMTQIANDANDLHMNGNQFVWMQFGFHQARPGEFLCQARLLYNNYGKNAPISIDVQRFYECWILSNDDVTAMSEFFARYLNQFTRTIFGKAILPGDLLKMIYKKDQERGEVGQTTITNICRFAKSTNRQLSADEVADIPAEELIPDHLVNKESKPKKQKEVKKPAPAKEAPIPAEKEPEVPAQELSNITEQVQTLPTEDRPQVIASEEVTTAQTEAVEEQPTIEVPLSTITETVVKHAADVTPTESTDEPYQDEYVPTGLEVVDNGDQSISIVYTDPDQVTISTEDEGSVCDCETPCDNCTCKDQEASEPSPIQDSEQSEPVQMDTSLPLDDAFVQDIVDDQSFADPAPAVVDAMMQEPADDPESDSDPIELEADDIVVEEAEVPTKEETRAPINVVTQYENQDKKSNWISTTLQDLNGVISVEAVSLVNMVIVDRETDEELTIEPSGDQRNTKLFRIDQDKNYEICVDLNDSLTLISRSSNERYYVKNVGIAIRESSV